MTNTPTQENEELLPCPFCGNQPFVEYEEWADGFPNPGIDSCLTIGCHSCGIEFNDYNSDSKWNTRPSPSTVSNGEQISKESLEVIAHAFPSAPRRS